MGYYSLGEDGEFISYIIKEERKRKGEKNYEENEQQRFLIS